MSTLFSQVRTAAEFIQARLALSPTLGLVLGSGLGALVDRITDGVVIPYGEIPEFPTTTVAGHAGNLVLGRAAGVTVAALQGRFHYYEGHELTQLTLPIRVLAALGARSLILTAATGGLRDTMRVGDLVCISDHLNMLGENPLRGVNDPRLGVRFLDMSEVYSRRLRGIARSAAEALGFSLAEAIYAAMPGPSYETPAEIRALQLLGADVVGMSTVPEAIVARQAGVEVLALALVANVACGLSDQPISHNDVLAAGRMAQGRMADLIFAVIERMDG